MVFTFKNLGPIKEATLELGDLTLLCGQNNTGKTYLTYGVYGFLKSYPESVNSLLLKKNKTKQIFEKLTSRGELHFTIEELSNYIDMVSISKAYKQYLPLIFGTNESHFKNTEVTVQYNITCLKQDILQSILKLIDFFGQNSSSFPFIFSDVKTNILTIKITDSIINLNSIDVSNFSMDYQASVLPYLLYVLVGDESFILSAERTNIRLFLNEIDQNRSNVINKLLHTGSGDIAETLNKNVARFAQPIQAGLDFARDLPQIVKFNSFVQKEHPELITYIEDMLGIQYMERDGQLLVMDTATQHTFPYYMASTSVRTLSDLHLWLKHQAQPNSILFIDEPELNIHSENQIKLARLFAKLVNIGIKVFITTHSEYIVKEFNNLITLSNEFKGKADFLKRHHYTEQDILKPDQIKSYIAEKGTLTAVPIDNFGLLYTTFDDSIEQINSVAGEIAFFIEESETVGE